MSMKKVGILGGLGPATTANFYLDLIRLGQATVSDSRPPVLMWSVPIPYELEKSCIVDGRGQEEMRAILVEGAQHLVRGGVDFLVMPCNSLHIFINDLRAAAGIPVLSIIDETVTHVREVAPKKVGLLGTSILISAGLYQDSLASAGIECVLPSEVHQRKLQEEIFNALNGCLDQDAQDVALSIIKEFRDQGVTHVILGCTDLHLFFPKTNDLEVIDSMSVLARATVREMQPVSMSGSSTSPVAGAPLTHVSCESYTVCVTDRY